MVKAGVFLVARLAPLFFALAAIGINMDQFFEVIAWVGAITALLLATQGMVHPEIKKVLAYSTGSTQRLHDDGTWCCWSFKTIR